MNFASAGINGRNINKLIKLKRVWKFAIWRAISGLNPSALILFGSPGVIEIIKFINTGSSAIIYNTPNELIRFC